jgi:hypothetical protein
MDGAFQHPVRLSRGRLAQVDRALVSGTKGRAFESRIAHHELKRAFGFSESPFFVCSLVTSPKLALPSRGRTSQR